MVALETKEQPGNNRATSRRVPQELCPSGGFRLTARLPTPGGQPPLCSRRNSVGQSVRKDRRLQPVTPEQVAEANPCEEIPC